jgi:hypothetical protein
MRRCPPGDRRARTGPGRIALIAPIAACAAVVSFPACVGVARDDAADVAEAAAAPAAESWTVSIEPRPEDIASIDGIVQAWYDIVSGPAGEPRNWSRDSTLYSPGVRFVIVGAGADGVERATVTDHGTFARESAPGFERNGFYEREIHRVTQRIGNVAYLLSTYEWRREPDGPVGGRGVNSISLFFDGARWWITQAMWSDETPANPIPQALLPAG